MLRWPSVSIVRLSISKKEKNRRGQFFSREISRHCFPPVSLAESSAHTIVTVATANRTVAVMVVVVDIVSAVGQLFDFETRFISWWWWP